MSFHDDNNCVQVYLFGHMNEYFLKDLLGQLILDSLIWISIRCQNTNIFYSYFQMFPVIDKRLHSESRVSFWGSKTKLFDFELALSWKICLYTSQILSKNWSLIEKHFEVPMFAQKFIIRNVTVYTYNIFILNYITSFQTLH